MRNNTFFFDDLLAEKLQRGNQYIINLKGIHRFHVTAYKKIKKVRKIELIVEEEYLATDDAENATRVV